jgi:hypothetical protein
MGKRLRLFGLSLLGGGLVLVAVISAVLKDPDLRLAARQIRFGGRPLLELRAPDGRQVVPLGGIEVLVGFSDEFRVLPETFRCLLNNEDVTDSLTLGSNGAGGSLYGLLEGENRLRVEVFGRGWWPGRYLEDTREVIIRVAPLPNIDRARTPGGAPPLTAPALALACSHPAAAI